jgi:hypothetical protein
MVFILFLSTRALAYTCPPVHSFRTDPSIYFRGRHHRSAYFRIGPFTFKSVHSFSQCA